MLAPEHHVAALVGHLSVRRAAQTVLRLATEADAEFLLSLRLDSSRSQHISATSPVLRDQVGWMRSYAARHAAGQEAYFLILDAGVPVGSVRLYDYQPGRDSFCWGSWIIRPGTHPEVSHRSILQVYDLGFGVLRFARAHFDVRQANVSVWRLHEKMGAKLVREDPLDRHYEYSIEDYLQARARLVKFAQGLPFP